MVTTITSALTGLEADLLSVAGLGLGIGVTIFGLRKGYKVVKSFI
jgi:Inovirus Coat protein B